MKPTFCTITPTRGDRPELLDFCKHQLSRMTLKPDVSYFIDHPPQNGKVDLQARIREGIARASSDGIDWAFIIEDDDYYAPNYFEVLIGIYKGMLGGNSNLEFMGYQDTIYYHLPSRRYQHIHHRGRASMFCTAFKVKAMEKMNWTSAADPFQDIAIWDWVRRMKKPTVMMGFGIQAPPPAMGMKHGIGKCGGSGHTMKMEHGDYTYGDEIAFLKKSVDAEAYEFYTQLIHKNGWNNK